MPRRVTPPCDYCNRPGYGNPPLCDEHYAREGDESPLHVVVDRALDNPGIKKLVRSATSAVDRLANIVDQILTTSHTTPPPKTAPSPRPIPAKNGISELQARNQLGFAHTAPLSKAGIKQRRRELAKIYHTDKGSDSDMMKRINVATDFLLAKTKN